MRGRDAKKRGAGENGRMGFWYTTAVFKPVKSKPKSTEICDKIAPKRSKYCVLSGKKYTRKKHKTTDTHYCIDAKLTRVHPDLQVVWVQAIFLALDFGWKIGYARGTLTHFDIL